jgi:hypothetical protein
MTAMVQYDFFSSKEETFIRIADDLKRSSDKVRRGTYAQINVQAKRIQDLEYRLEILEHNLCKSQSQSSMAPFFDRIAM